MEGKLKINPKITEIWDDLKTLINNLEYENRKGESIIKKKT